MVDALVLDGVSKIYEVGGVELVALQDVDLTVAEEEVVTLLGPSGSGKTTLLSIAGGLLSATSGKVIVGGKNITRARARKLTAFRRKRIGFIFQAVNLVPFLTARENLLVVAELARRDRSAAARRADRLLEELGLGHRVNNLPSQLSGGERQRVAIGRALMNQPALVLVDEPTSALDSDLGQQVMELIVSEVKARGAAAVIVTHDGRMARYGDRILTMADGRIAGMAPRPEFTLNRGPAPAAALAPARDLRALPAAAPSAQYPAFDPASGQFPAAGRAGATSAPYPADDGWGAEEPGFGSRSGQVPAAGRESAYGPAAGHGPGTGRAGATSVPYPADDGWEAEEPGFGPRSGQVPAGLWANGPAVSRGPGADGAGPGSGQVPAVGRDREVPAGLWANGPAVSRGPGADGAGPGSGQVPAVGRDREVPAGLWANGPAVSREGAGPRSGQVPAAYGQPPPISQQTPAVAPDRVWRRPATPPSSRQGGGRRPPPLLPASSLPSPTGWPGPPEAGPGLQPEAPAPPAPWGTPELFADPPAQPVPPVTPPPRFDEPPTNGVDPIESDRVRWLQQLTPPPTKAQPRPLSLPDRPIWPTRYWDGEASSANGDNPDADAPYDFGEYDDEP